MIVALAILLLVRETGVDRRAAVARGSVARRLPDGPRRPDHRWIYLASVLGGGGRGLGIVNLFALAYLTIVIGLPEATTNLMYGALIVLSVPMPLVAGWLSDRIGRRPVIIGVYVGGAIAFVVFLARRLVSIAGLWLGIAADGPVQLRRVAPAPGAPRRRRRPDDPRHLVRPLLHARVRRRLALDVRSTAGSRPSSATSPGLPIVFLLMAVVVHPRGAGGDPDPRARRRRHVAPAERGGLTDRRPAGPPAGRPRRLCYHAHALHNGHSVGAWRSLVARIVRDDKVVGSNPAAPTIPPASERSNSAGGRGPRPSA